MSSVLRALRVGVSLVVLALCLFSDSQPLKNSGALAELAQEIRAALAHSDTQWMVLLCVGAYLVAFIIVRTRLRGEVGIGAQRDIPWAGYLLTYLIVSVAVVYARRYTEATQSTQALTLAATVVLGQGAALWAATKVRSQRNEACGLENVASPAVTVIAGFVVLLTAATAWQAGVMDAFQYRGEARWSGPWDNPNTFGVLMGIGAVLALGRLGPSLTSKVQRLKSAAQSLFLIAAVGVMGFGLIKSYSRGAWLGAAVGFAYLAWNMGHGKGDERRTSNVERRTLNRWRAAGTRITVGVILLSLVVIGFWSFRQTEGLVTRRAYTVANVNDFSWRNRVAAYEGALQMMAEQPWFGFGWNQPERVYDQYYRAAKVDEGAAIQLNDYFTLGMTLGIPALLCFVVYVGLALRGTGTSNIEHRTSNAEPRTSAFSVQPLALPLVCRAGALVLAVGFWFDGGLFTLATGATFWILLELGRSC